MHTVEQDVTPVGAPTPLAGWVPSEHAAAFSEQALRGAASRFREPAFVVREASTGRLGVAFGGTIAAPANDDRGLSIAAVVPALYPEWLGARSFCELHRVRFPYVAGEMANGIATSELVIAMARARMLAFFGAAGLSAHRVASAVDTIERALGPRAAWGVNLIHSPHEPALEDQVADLLIRRNVRRVSASAFMTLTPAVVRYAASGLTTTPSGQIARANQLFAKLSRPEVARRFMSPAPSELLQGLVTRGLLTAREAELARRVPVAEDITVEADSGGHTDNQSLTALFPTIMALRAELSAEHGYTRPIRLGAAGGLGTPAALAAAFALGADYVLTGSVNQAAVEAGTSAATKALLAQAAVADVAMAPSADMFELGVKVQVLKRGTLFAARASKLYETYLAYPGLDAIPQALRKRLENEVLGAPLDQIVAETRRFWSQRDPAQLDKAERDPKHSMALAFRWYLGGASRWAIEGEPARRADYQIWCGPAMGAFNAWTRGSFLADPENRSVVQIALNLLEGAAAITRAQQLRTAGVPLPSAAFDYRPRLLA